VIPFPKIQKKVEPYVVKQNLNNEFQTGSPSVLPILQPKEKTCKIFCTKDSFEPSHIEIEAGTTLIWEIKTEAREDDSSLYLKNGESRKQMIALPDLSLESDLIKVNQPYKLRLTLLGDIKFHSLYNNRLKGIVTVVRPKVSAPTVVNP
jgi:hypothetical protein